jgi:glucosamine-6-phosphate deaminase
MPRKRSVITDKYEVLSAEIACAVAAQLHDKPDSCFGLPTGNSPLGTYKLLAEWSKEKKLDWSRTRCFALDEYLMADESMTFQHYLEEHLYQFTNIEPANKHNPALFDNYDAMITEQGGLDLTLLGLGANGHIAFNEPGTPPDSWTHCLWLTESTRRANQSYFSQDKKVPDRAVTMGLKTILASKKLILLVSGEHKRAILEQALLEDSYDPEIPASYLSLHPHVTVLTDFDF